MESIPFVIAKSKVNLYYTVKEKEKEWYIQSSWKKVEFWSIIKYWHWYNFFEVQVLSYLICITKSLSNEFNDQNNVQPSNINDCNLKYDLFNAADLTTLELIEIYMIVRIKAPMNTFFNLDSYFLIKSLIAIPSKPLFQADNRSVSLKFWKVAHWRILGISIFPFLV